MAAAHREPLPIAPTVGHELPRHGRLIHAYEFRRVYKHGQRARGSHLVVVALTRRSPGFRLGLSVSKAHGGAVRRNKIKRIFREAFRLERPTFRGQLDIILIPQPRERYELQNVRHELVQLVEKAASKRSRRPRKRR